METSLLATKFYIPPIRPGLVTRPRLLEHLQNCINYPLVLVSAPAGYGKSTLLSEWILHGNESYPCAWLTLDAEDKDSLRFWTYVVTALKKINPSIGAMSLPSVQSIQKNPIENSLIVLINEITSVAEDFVLILDDYHLVDLPQINQEVTYLLEHIPPSMHLIISTRVDPSLPLARYRGKGTIMELREDDLRFTTGETERLLSEIVSTPLSTEDVNALNTKAEGWAAGLKMAGLTLRDSKDLSVFISDFTGTQRYIMDFLIEEVLQKQSPQVREFLLKTSVLERLCGPLCNAVTQASNGRATLINLEKANLFLIPLDATQEWYRYHHLFAELLQHQLDLEFGKELKDEIHRRACNWYGENGFHENAIDHALLAQDWEKATTIISQFTVIMPYWGSSTILNWLRKIPEDSLQTNITLLFNYVWALMGPRQFEAVADRLKHLESIVGHNSLLQGRIMVARAYAAWSEGNFTLCEDYTNKARALLFTHISDDLKPDELSDIGMSCLLLADPYMRQSLFKEAEPLIKEALELYTRAGYTTMIIYTLSNLAIIESLKGKLHDAAKTYERIIELANGDPSAATTHLYLSNVYHELNELDQAAFHVDQAIKLIPISRKLEIHAALLYLVKNKIAKGDMDGARKALDRADQILSEGQVDPDNRLRNAAYHAYIALIKGDTQSARRWVEDLVKSSDPFPHFIPVQVIRLVLTIRGKTAENQNLNEAYDLSVKQGHLYQLISVLIIRALDELGNGDPLDSLAIALTKAKPEGSVRVFVDFGMELAPLLRQAIIKGFEPEYTRKLLDVIEKEERARQTLTAKGKPIPQSSEFLSLRELEVLQLAGEGLSNREIADKLIITLGTAKTHIHNIAQKLDAKNRIQAIARAKELELL